MTKGHAVVRHGVITLASALLAVFLLAPAHAQAPGRGMRMAPANTQAAWATEAKHVANKLDLPEEPAGKLVKAYTEARNGYIASMNAKREEMRGASGDRRSMGSAFRAAIEEVRKTEREKFSTALSEFLTEEQTKKALNRLGTFSSSLDRMVHTLTGFKLGDEKQAKTLDLVFAYNAELAKLWSQGPGEQQDFGAMREKMAEMKAKLDTKMADILSNEQMAVWNDATTYRGRALGGGGQTGPRDGRGRGAGGGSASSSPAE